MLGWNSQSFNRRSRSHTSTFKFTEKPLYHGQSQQPPDTFMSRVRPSSIKIIEMTAIHQECYELFNVATSCQVC